MKRYIFFRILRSLISIILVTTVAYAMIFTLVPRNSIFIGDPAYSRLKGDPDKRTNYENTVFRKMGYIDFMQLDEIAQRITGKTEGTEFDAIMEGMDEAAIQEWEEENREDGWELHQLPVAKTYYATREIPVLQRVLRFYANIIDIDHPWKIHDPDNPDLPRYIRFENTPEAGFTLTGSGTQHKYLLYFNSSFPFIHQNIINLNLGISYPTFQSRGVMDVIFSGQGKTSSREITFETGKTENSPINIYSRQYQPSAKIDRLQRERFNDNYTLTTNNYQDPSMAQLSLSMGVIALIITYVIGLSAAVFMARHKGRWGDRIGVAIVTVLISVPSLAFIYLFRFIGNAVFGLPADFPVLGGQDIRSYILPTAILGLLSVSGQVIWVRRYMIDQASSDYVHFARAKGLSEREISRKHILKNALIPIVNYIPGAVILSIAGATITETVFAAPGMGKMLPDAIKAYNNSMVIGLVFIFTTLSILSVLIGDILMTIIDPRINLSVKKGAH